MMLEQRIGRIGQKRAVTDIVNLFYAGTAEWDAYQAMLERLKAIHGQVGTYQPILYDPASAGRMAAIIRANGERHTARAAVQNIASEVRLNLDVLNSTPEQATLPTPAISMADIWRALTEPGLLPDGRNAEHCGDPHWLITRPNGNSRLVTTDPASYEYDGTDAKWFGPGNWWWLG